MSPNKKELLKLIATNINSALHRYSSVVVAFHHIPGFSPILNVSQKQVKMRARREEKQEGEKRTERSSKKKRKTVTPWRGKSHIKRSKDERIP